MRSLLIAAVVATATPALAQQPVEVPMIGNTGEEIGKITLAGGPRATVIRIMIAPGHLQPGWHGIHFHAVGDCSDTAKFEASKAHVKHGGAKHGLLNPEGPEEGDLPNVFAAADGSVNAEVATGLLLDGAQGLKDADGTALVVHANPDDHTSQPIGGAGARLGCAAIK